MTSDPTTSATKRALPVVPAGVAYDPATPGASSYIVTAQPEATRAEAFGGEFDWAAEDYERRVVEGRPYENTVDREEFRRRYGV